MPNETQNAPADRQPRLLDRVRDKCRLLHYSIRTESAYTDWISRFLRFHRLPDGTWRHPAKLTGPEIGKFLTHLAVDGKVSASTQNQALCAIVFLFRQVLEIDPGNVDGVRAQKPERLPTVLSISEVRQVLEQCPAGSRLRLIMELFYGTGMRLLEVCRLRIKDVDFERHQIIVRDGKGEKDRAVPLPLRCEAALLEQINSALLQHRRDLSAGYPHCPGITRACGCQHDHDLYTCPANGTAGGEESAGSVVSDFRWPTRNRSPGADAARLTGRMCWHPVTFRNQGFVIAALMDRVAGAGLSEGSSGVSGWRPPTPATHSIHR
jgi:hypothetical protein